MAILEKIAVSADKTAETNPAILITNRQHKNQPISGKKTPLFCAFRRVLTVSIWSVVRVSDVMVKKYWTFDRGIGILPIYRHKVKNEQVKHAKAK